MVDSYFRQPDGVLMLAVIHHLAITERVPLPEILEMAALFTTRMLVIEWVHPKDAMFQVLLRGRDLFNGGLTQEAFGKASPVRFTIQRELPLPGLDRCLYLLIRN